MQAMETKSGANVLSALLRGFQKLGGSPQKLQSDNAAEFKGEPVASEMAKRNVQLVHGRTYHPQSQGAVERSNGVSKNAFYSRVREAGLFESLDALQGAYIYIYVILLSYFVPQQP